MTEFVKERNPFWTQMDPPVSPDSDPSTVIPSMSKVNASEYWREMMSGPSLGV